MGEPLRGGHSRPYQWAPTEGTRGQSVRGGGTQPAPTTAHPHTCPSLPVPGGICNQARPVQPADPLVRPHRKVSRPWFLFALVGP